MSIQNKYEELIESSYTELETLKSEVTQLEDIRKNIENLIGSNNELPKIFAEKFKKIIKLTDDYTNALGAATKKYLDGNNTLFTIKLSELSNKIKEFESEITRLVNTDLTKLFNELQKAFIDQTRADLAIEIKQFEDKSKELQAKINDLKKQVDRLEQVDLEKHFDKHQKTLAEIFQAINSINMTLTNVVQTLTGIVQTSGTILTNLENNHKILIGNINDTQKIIREDITAQDTHMKKYMETMDNQLKLIITENKLTKKDIKTNKRMLMVIIIVLILIYFFPRPIAQIISLIQQVFE